MTSSLIFSRGAIIAGVILSCSIPLSASATRLMTAASLNDVDVMSGGYVVVPPAESMTAAFSVNLTNTSAWRATAWKVGASPIGGYTCIDHADHLTDGANVDGFSIPAPATDGIYNLYIRLFPNDECSGSQPTLTFAHSIRVANGKTGEIRGYKAEARDEKGHHPRLPGWTIYLDLNANSFLDENDIATTTNASGNFRFTGLPAGAYTVREVLQAGWSQLLPVAGAYAVILEEGEKIKDKEKLVFVNYRPASISGVKCKAVPPHMKKCEGKPSLSGWTIELHKLLATTTPVTTSTLFASTVTNADGAYSFTNLAPGYYTVREVLADGWEQVRGVRIIRLDSGEEYARADFVNRHLVLDEEIE
ncbi:MAG: hypothetical protein Q7R54_02175 [bacterium]|nr:hypothetical protein [bacterium]